MGPTGTTQWGRCSRARAKPHLDGADCVNSVRSILAKSKQRVGQANSVGLIAHFGGNEIPQQATKSLQGHLSETEIRIGVTELLGFLAVAMSTELGGTGWIILVGPSLTLGFGQMLK